MSIEQAEQLKRELTDKWVVVDRNVPELRRFSGLTGKVRTVNMNCRALVEFNGPADIGWYDIDPGFLTVVDAPVARPQPAHEEKEKPAAKAPASKPAGGPSPLELARKQGAGSAPAKTGAKPEAKAGAVAGGAGKPSPLDLIRRQGAAKSGAAGSSGESSPAPETGSDSSEAAAPAEQKPAARKPAATAGEKLSPLDLIRKQGPAKK